MKYIDAEKLKAEFEKLVYGGVVTDIEDTIRLISEQPAADVQEVINQLKAENAALKARLDKAVELPCTVGDTVYRIGKFSDSIVFGIIDKITLSKFEPTFKCESEEIFYLFDEEDIGKTIFFTEAEAQAKLEEMKGGTL